MAQDTIEKTPTQDTSVNKPASGTYGEKADRERLRKSLPPMRPQQQAGGGPAPMRGMPGRMPDRAGGRPVSAPGGVPSAILKPTDQPGTPVNSPRQLPQEGPMSPVATAENIVAARIALLQQLATSNEVSAETREWAKLVLEMMNG